MTATPVACPECDLLQQEIALAPRAAARCARCGAVLLRNRHAAFDRALPFALGAAMLFVVANVYPVFGMDIQGQYAESTLFGTVHALHDREMTPVAALVFATALLMPALEIAAMLYLLLPLRFGRVPAGTALATRLIAAVRPWGMLDVLMLGILVALVKLSHLASIVPGVALWSYGAVILLLAASAASFDTRELWRRVEALR